MQRHVSPSFVRMLSTSLSHMIISAYLFGIFERVQLFPNRVRVIALSAAAYVETVHYNICLQTAWKSEESLNTKKIKMASLHRADEA